MPFNQECEPSMSPAETEEVEEEEEDEEFTYYEEPSSDEEDCGKCDACIFMERVNAALEDYNDGGVSHAIGYVKCERQK